MVLSLLVFASLSMSVWAHHMLTIEGVAVKYFALTSTLLIVPAGMEYLTLLATLHGGRVRPTVAMLFALAFLVQFLVGGLSGIWVASPALDAHANNSYVVVAHFHYTLLAGSIFGFFAGVYHWWPKVTGRLLGERLGRVHLALFVLGTNLTFAPQFALGEDGMTRRIADYPADAGWSALNLLSTVGASWSPCRCSCSWSTPWSRAGPRRTIPGVATRSSGRRPSPPPRGNFATAPTVRSYAPLLDA